MSTSRPREAEPFTRPTNPCREAKPLRPREAQPFSSSHVSERFYVAHLIDGTYELFRHFCGLRRFNKCKDRPYGAVVSVFQTALRMIENGETYLGVTNWADFSARRASSSTGCASFAILLVRHGLGFCARLKPPRKRLRLTRLHRAGVLCLARTAECRQAGMRGPRRSH